MGIRKKREAGVSAGKLEGGQRLSDQAFEMLRQAITRCELAPGQIVSEPQLEEQFALGKVSIRLAMDRLIQLKLVTPIHRRGFEIAPIVVADLRETFELRRLVEPSCFRIAAQQGVDLNELRRLDKLMLENPLPVDRKVEAIVIDANRDFHMTVVRASRNDRIISLMEKVLSDIDRAYFFGLMRHPKFWNMQRQHGQFLNALEARDEAESERLAREHIDQGYAIVIDAVVMGVSLTGKGAKL